GVARADGHGSVPVRRHARRRDRCRSPRPPFVVAEPADAVPWLARPAHLEALAALLRFTKLPPSWRWRPAEWPVWNHEIERALRVWSADGGRDQPALDALAARRLDGATVDAPASSDALLAELLVERDVGRRHLATVTE